MQTVEGQARIVVRARIMRLLREQFISDEIAAISELVKNSWNADAKRVIVTLFNVSETDGYIQIIDNGHGMTRETVFSSWLELGTLSKTRTPGEKMRKSESGKRHYLGGMGLGHLAINKLGEITEMVTRRTNENLETQVVLDWAKFETAELLNDIPVSWKQRSPVVFVDRPSNAQMDEETFPNGTRITINKLQKQWTKNMINRLRRTLRSNFACLTEFNVEVLVHDKLDLGSQEDLKDLVKFSIYSFDGKMSDRDLYFQNRIYSLESQVDALNNSVSLRIGRKMPFGRTIRRMLVRHE